MIWIPCLPNTGDRDPDSPTGMNRPSLTQSCRNLTIDDLDRSGEVRLREVPDPLGSITHDDFLLRPAPAALPGFYVDALAKLFSRLDGAGVSSGTRVADRVACLVPGGLGEDAPQLGFPCVGRLAGSLA